MGNSRLVEVLLLNHFLSWTRMQWVLFDMFILLLNNYREEQLRH